MPGQMRELALKRTTFDFDCPYDQLSVVKISSTNYGIKGCGKGGVYFVNCVLQNGTFLLINYCNAVLSYPNASSD